MHGLLVQNRLFVERLSWLMPWAVGCDRGGVVIGGRHCMYLGWGYCHCLVTVHVAAVELGCWCGCVVAIPVVRGWCCAGE